MFESLKRKIFRQQLELLLKDLDEADGYVFALEGKLVYCHGCGEHVKLPPIKIPLRIQVKDKIPGSEGRAIAHDTIYGHFHVSCAIKHLLSSQVAADLIPNQDAKTTAKET